MASSPAAVLAEPTASGDPGGRSQPRRVSWWAELKLGKLSRAALTRLVIALIVIVEVYPLLWLLISS
ncbi:MAG TPA: hypothetical protein VMD59_16945, partial [Acidimicrobiales bacterium]|nr:hypothetical protein [Acidimicrobiales bacterium]